MSAQSIYARAPLGALVRYSDGQPMPPERHRKKLAAWKSSNGSGRLVRKTHAAVRPTYTHPAGFTLHEGNFGSEGVIVLVVHKSFSVNSTLTFEIVEEPAPGSVRVLTSFQGEDELRHLAPDMAAAEDWLSRNHYTGARLEVVREHEASAETLGQAA